MKDYIYLDYAAHTPADQAVLEAFCKAECTGNANSVHAAGREAKTLIDEATNTIAQLLQVNQKELIYTSGASESNNMAIKGFAKATRHIGKHIISTPLEHSSVSGTLTALQEQGYEIDILNITTSGKIDLEQLSELIRKDTVLLCVSAVDGELGVVQPIDEIVALLSEYPKCYIHVDATQAIGKIDFSFKGLHSVSFTPHKFFGICGSGVLWKKEGLVLEPLIHGGASTTIYRSGTPTVSLAVATAAALQKALENKDQQYQHVKQLNQFLREHLTAFPLVTINSPIHAIPHILNISVKGIKGADFQRLLDKNGVCVSVKSACSVANTPSRAVFAVSRDKKNAMSSWRISLSSRTTQQEINCFLEIFSRIYQEVINGTRA